MDILKPNPDIKSNTYIPAGGAFSFSSLRELYRPAVRALATTTPPFFPPKKLGWLRIQKDRVEEKQRHELGQERNQSC